MITLKSDRLSFSFPEIADALRKLIEHHVESVLPRIFAEYRQGCATISESSWDSLLGSADLRKAAMRKVLETTPQEIEAALRQQCFKKAGLELESDAVRVRVEFQRTLRIPDDGKEYPLPAGLGRFPLRLVDDFAKNAPAPWLQRGGVLMPMYQSEALWINFGAHYPVAVKVASGKINAVTGEAWEADLREEPQNYLVLPQQPWLDGFAVKKGIIRQFVAMPLGDGYSVEEQVTGAADVGGIQIQVFPMKAAAYFNGLAAKLPACLKDYLREMIGDWPLESCMRCYIAGEDPGLAEGATMGLGAGGKMRQEIYDDPNNFADWDTTVTSRCFIHLCNSLVWRQITESDPPHPPLTSKEYAKAHIPWFDYYRDDLSALKGSKVLDDVKSVAAVGKEKGMVLLPNNSTIAPELIVQYGNARRPNEVREWVEQ